MKFQVFVHVLVFIVFGATTVGKGNSATIEIEFGPGNIAIPDFSGGNVLDIDIPVPSDSLTLSGVLLTVEGDLNNTDEFFGLTIDGLSLGTILNDNTTDDPFDFSGGTDSGSNDGATGYTQLMLDISSIVGDGMVTLSFFTSEFVDAPGAVNDGTFPGLTGQFAAKGVLTVETSDVATVPIPASLPLLSLGVLGLGLLVGRRRLPT